jgi:hypothetical protein
VSASDFASGNASLGDGSCGPGTAVTVGWTVVGMSVTYNLPVTGADPSTHAKGSRRGPAESQAV